MPRESDRKHQIDVRVLTSTPIPGNEAGSA
jgi:hypothetical protein